MSNVLRTPDDGWDCIPELKQASECLEEARHEKYEIDNCSRLTNLDCLVRNLKRKLQDAIHFLEQVDTDVEIEQVEED